MSHTHLNVTAFFIQTQILDAGAGESTMTPTTVAGTRDGLIGRIVLGERALRLPGPGEGPPCKVLELPIELPTSTTTVTAAKGRERHVSSGLSNRKKRPGTIILFLERVLPPPPTHSRSSQDMVVSSPSLQGAPSTQTRTAINAAETAAAHDATATETIGRKNKYAESALTGGAPAAITKMMHGEDRSEQHPRVQPRPQRLPAREKMQLNILSAWGLSSRSKTFDVVVTVMACGRSVGTTHVSSIGRTTSPEWIDER